MVYERTPYFLYIYTYSCCFRCTPPPPWHSCLPTYYLPLRLWLLGAIIIIILFFSLPFFLPFLLYQYLRDFYLLFSFLLLFFCCCCCVHSHNNLSDSVVTRKHNIKRMKREEERKMISLHVFRDVSPWSSLHFLIYSVSSSSWAKMMMTVL